MTQQQFLQALAKKINTKVSAKALYDDIRINYTKINYLHQSQQYNIVIFIDEIRLSIFTTTQINKRFSKTKLLQTMQENSLEDLVSTFCNLKIL
jgi:hypothetical protein